MLSCSWHVVRKCQIAGALIEKKTATEPWNIYIDESLWDGVLLLLSEMCKGGIRMDSSTACILHHKIHSRQPCYIFSEFFVAVLPQQLHFGAR